MYYRKIWTAVNKKRAAHGLPPRKITDVANTNVKNIKYENKNSSSSQANKVSSASTTETTGKKMGIAAKANMVKNYNEKNNKK